jgi:WD40 repeat protein
LGTFGDYELVEKVAEGGMGVVYRARQLSLNRIVAVKMIQPGRVGSPEMVLRFRAEAEAAASLHHPNIVPIHETGECEGQHYFSMDYIEGRSLAEAVREGPLPSGRAAELVGKIAAAVHYAHLHKILHRDLKPSNVLLDEVGEPHVTDFGLARRLGGDSSLTLTGQVFGSPQFMPPEQASGRHGAVGVQSDVYGLGAVLYHVLTARPPFVGETMETTLAQVLEQEPVSPRLLNASVPRDLETICLKCLEKEPSRRYVSAQAVADELGRFLRKEPILARPVSRPEKVWRWCRRKPALATALGAVVLVAAVGLVGIFTQWRRAEGQRRQAELQRQNAEASELFARQNAYAAAMNLAQRALANNEVGQAISLLEKYRPTGKSEPDLRHWEWRYLWQLCEGDELSILHRYSSGINSVAVSRDGKLLAVGKGTGVPLWDLTAQRPIAELPETAFKLAFSPTDSLLAVATWNEADQPVVKLWNVNSRELTATLTNEASLQSLAFSPDGGLLATLDDKGSIRVTEWESSHILVRKTLIPIRRPEAGVVAFLPDGHRLAIGGDMGELLLLDLQSGKVTPLQTQTADGVTALAVSPAGDLMAAGFGYTDGTIGLWELSTGKALEKLTNHTAYVRALAFTPDGRRLVSGGADGTIRVWSVADRTELWRFRAYRHGVVALALLPDGKTLVSGGPDGALCRWDCSAPIETRAHASLVISHGLQSQSGLPAASYGPGPPDPKGVRRFGVAFAPDSRSFITSDPEGALAVYDARSMQIIERLAALGTNNWGVALSPDGRWLAAANASGKIEIWDWKARHATASLVLPFQWVGIIRFSRTGQFLLASSTANDHLSTDLRVWGTRDWAEVPAGRVHHSSLLAADLSPDDRLLALADLDGTVQLSTFPSGHPLANFKKREGYFAVRFSPDGRLLALARRYGSVALWDVVNRRDFATLAGHALTAWGAVFSSDGRRLLTAGRNPKDAVKLWDIATQSELLVLPAEGQIFCDVGFSPDGNTLFASSFAGVAHFWRAPSWAEIEAAEKGQATP